MTTLEEEMSLMQKKMAIILEKLDLFEKRIHALEEESLKKTALICKLRETGSAKPKPKTPKAKKKAAKSAKKTAKSAKKINYPRPFFERAWRRGLLDVVVPETIAECERKFGAVLALGKISFADLKMNPHSQPAIQKVIDHLMQFPENHNFCIRSRRCYCCRPDGTWTAKDEISRKRFFDKIREKIWAKYRPLVLESLHRQGASQQILDFAATHFKEHIMRWNNEDVQRALEKHRPVLEVAWNQRVMKPRGTP